MQRGRGRGYGGSVGGGPRGGFGGRGGGGGGGRGGGGGGGSLSHHEKMGGARVDLESTVCCYLGPLHGASGEERRQLIASIAACAATLGPVAAQHEVVINLSHRSPSFCDREGVWAQRACLRLDLTFDSPEPAVAAADGLLRARLCAPGAHPAAVARVFSCAATAPRITRPRLPGAASYSAPRLHPRELLHAFYAAGIVPWRVNGATAALEVLLGEEVRKGAALELSLLMGKREDARDADAADCAARETDEEAALFFGLPWRARMAAVLRGVEGQGARGGSAAAPSAGAAACGEGAGSGGSGAGADRTLSAAQGPAEAAEGAERPEDALTRGLGSLSIAGASRGSSGAEAGPAPTPASPPQPSPLPCHACWLQDAKGAVFLVPIAEMLQGTALTASTLPQAHAQKRASMSPAQLAAGECSMHSLVWCPASTVLKDARLGAFARSALRPILEALHRLRRL